jgi:hypothetical protein
MCKGQRFITTCPYEKNSPEWDPHKLYVNFNSKFIWETSQVGSQSSGINVSYGGIIPPCWRFVDGNFECKYYTFIRRLRWRRAPLSPLIITDIVGSIPVVDIMISMWKESVNALPKVVSFLRLLWFLPTGNVDRVSWD